MPKLCPLAVVKLIIGMNSESLYCSAERAGFVSKARRRDRNCRCTTEWHDRNRNGSLADTQGPKWLERCLTVLTGNMN